MVSGAFGNPYGSPSARRPMIRWGIPDFVVVWIGGIVASVATSAVVYAFAGGSPDDAAVVAGAVFGQFGGWIVGCALITSLKGGSVVSDLGLAVSARDLWAVPAGVGIFVLASVAISPIVQSAGESQAVVDELRSASGAELAVFALTAAAVAPFAEELLFRGLLLRALRRRIPTLVAVIVQAMVFAAVHPLLSPTLGDFAVVPALFALGVVCGVVASRRADLSATVFLHVGFNLVTVLLAVFGI